MKIDISYFDLIDLHKSDVTIRTSEGKINGYLVIDKEGQWDAYAQKSMDSLKENETIFIEFEYRNSFYVIEIKDYKYTNNRISFITPKHAEKIQNRDYVRVRCDIPCDVNSSIKGKIVNISGGGARIQCSGENIKDDNIKLHFVLSGKIYDIICKIRHKDSNGLRVEYLKLSETERSGISKYVLHEDLKRRYL